VQSCNQDLALSKPKLIFERKSETNSPITFSKNKKKPAEQIRPISFRNQENDYESFLFEKNTSRKESTVDFFFIMFTYLDFIEEF